MLTIAEERTKERGISNVSFRIGDVQSLPFEKVEFDVVVSRLALHHMQNPALVVGEMTRVCRLGGRALVEDICGSEHPARAASQDRGENDLDASQIRLR